jgi:hypothetical protein
MKNPPTIAGIEPATFRFVAQHLNHCDTAVPCTSLRAGHKFDSRLLIKQTPTNGEQWKVRDFRQDVCFLRMVRMEEKDE